MPKEKKDIGTKNTPKENQNQTSKKTTNQPKEQSKERKGPSKTSKDAKISQEKGVTSSAQKNTNLIHGNLPTNVQEQVIATSETLESSVSIQHHQDHPSNPLIQPQLSRQTEEVQRENVNINTISIENISTIELESEKDTLKKSFPYETPRTDNSSQNSKKEVDKIANSSINYKRITNQEKKDEYLKRNYLDWPMEDYIKVRDHFEGNLNISWDSIVEKLYIIGFTSLSLLNFISFNEIIATDLIEDSFNQYYDLVNMFSIRNSMFNNSVLKENHDLFLLSYEEVLNLNESVKLKKIFKSQSYIKCFNNWLKIFKEQYQNFKVFYQEFISEIEEEKEMDNDYISIQHN